MEDEQTKSRLKSALDAILKAMTTATNLVLSVAMVGLSLILGANIALRYLFGEPISWSNAVSRYAYIYIVLLGTAISYLEGSHATIDVAYVNASPKLKAVFDFFHYIIMMFLCVLLIGTGMKHVIKMWHVNSPVLTSFSMGIVYLSVPLSSVIMLVFLVRKIIDIKFKLKVKP
jgi:TRAP-type C4-dicarboxylate transport system permease small subunit